MSLARKIARRKGLRSSLIKTMDEVNSVLAANNESEPEEAKIMGFKVRLEKVIQSLEILDDEIVSGLEPGEVEADTVESMDVLEPTHELLSTLQLRIEKLRVDTLKASRSEVEGASISSTARTCKLPKLELRTFKGDVLEWRGFEEQFLSTVHNNESISEIDKFIYLKRYLGDSALAVVSGLSLSSSNYSEALVLLRDRYGNPQVLISAYMESLLKLGKVRSLSDVSALRKLANDIENCVRNLRSMKVETSTYGSLLIPILKERLPDELVFHISRRFGSDVWTLDLLIEFMNKEIQASENCVTFLKDSSSFENDMYSAYNLNVGTQSNGKQCVFCHKDNHSPSQCRKVTNVQSRIEILKKNRRCFVCLEEGHTKRNCESKYVCRGCNGRHNISICYGKRKDYRPDERKKEPAKTVEQNFAMSVRQESETILLQTANAEVFDSWEREKSDVKILFDSGSQRSFIVDNLRKKLGLKTERKEKVVIKTFGEKDLNEPTYLDVVKFKVKSKGHNSYTFIEALCVPKICGFISKTFDTGKYGHLRDLNLADSFDAGGFDFPVGLLVGVDFYYDFFTGRIERGKYGPVASETKVGWVLSGKVKATVSDEESFCFHSMRCTVEHERGDDELRKSLDRFWAVENIDSKDCVVHRFEREIVHNGDRYEVKLPFKPDHDTLPDNFCTAKKRLESLEKRLSKNKLLKDYEEVFKSYEKEKIIEKVPNDEICKDVGLVHYLPHRPVVRQDKETTKIRAVFDASCAVNGPSLNDCLYSGPNLISKIFDVLLRFRLNKVAILADIKQAFLNVEVAKEHRDFVRFLWRDSESDELVIYRFLRVVFGVTSSPFLLNGTIKHHLQKFRKTDPVLIDKLMDDFYVDDLVSGCECTEEGRLFYEKSLSIMKKAGFELRKWVTNDVDLMSLMDSDGEKMKQVLGVDWDILSDEFIFDFKKFLDMCENLSSLTKRNILSVSASFFDPLGVISPVTARVKVIFQLLCKNKLDWDDEVSQDLSVLWFDFLSVLRDLDCVRLKRFVLQSGIKRVELCGFSDSSAEVYCAVVYLRVVTDHGVFVNFLCAKTKVAPLKVLTIPKLELLGCLLLTDLIKECEEALRGRVEISGIFCWSDSEIALCWIKGKERMWKPWVENRVVKIRSVVDRGKWFHVSGPENPADFPTRSFEFFSDVWINGPRFLFDFSIVLKDFDNENRSLGDDVNTMKRQSMVESLTLSSIAENKSVNSLLSIVDISRFSSLRKLITIVAYIFRFVNNLKKRVNKHQKADVSEVLTPEECEQAYVKLIIEEQCILREQRDFKKQKNSLNLFEDTDGVLRLRGRFSNADMTYQEKFPALLRCGSWFTVLVILDAHKRCLHHGVETTLSYVRERFWLVRGRKTVKNVLRRCVLCKRYNSRTLVPPPTPDIPSFRLDATHSFQFTGLDFAGPLFIKGHSDFPKVYILLLTCATSRAIHLELVPDLGNDAFIRACTRFFSRRGYPDMVVHDNAKTFHSKDVKHFLLRKGIKQQFILAHAPWWGGFYERLVRNVKTSLRKVLAKSILTYEELLTVLCEVESSINSRPLSYLSEDDIISSLTPFHLMFGRNILTSKSDTNTVNILNSDVMFSKRVKHIQTLIGHFWRRFSTTYLMDLRQLNLYRRQTKDRGEQLAVDDVVLLVDEIRPRNQWRLGRVSELVIGRDGRCRGAKLQTYSRAGRVTFCSRPLQKLVLLLQPDELVPVVADKAHNDKCARDRSSVSNRIPRKAAIDGQYLRQIREKFM